MESLLEQPIEETKVLKHWWFQVCRKCLDAWGGMEKDKDGPRGAHRTFG